MSLSVFAGKHSAGGKYVFSPGSSYSTGNSLIGNSVPEVLHDDCPRGILRGIPHLVEADQVHPAFQTPEQADKGIGVTLVIIQALEHGIFEAHTPLAREIVLAQQLHYFPDVPGLLDRHHQGALLTEWIVETDGHMAAAAVQVLLQGRNDSDGGKGPAARPSP